MESCIVCKSNAVINRQDSASRTIYNCQNCGVFIVSDLIENEVRDRIPEISAFLTGRKLLDSGETVLISYNKANIDKDYLQLTVDQIIDLYPKNFTGQMEMSLKNLERMSKYAGDEVKIDDLKMAPLFYVKKMSFEAMSFVIKSMQHAGLVEVNYYSGTFFPCGLVISPQGWDRLAELEREKSGSEDLFVCAPRNDKAIREQFLKATRKASLECGFNLLENCLVGIESGVGNGLIASVKSAKAVICDMSETMGEAYYSAAFARALNKVCILTCHKSAEKQLQVKTSDMNVIFWDKPEQLGLELYNALKANL